MSITLKVNTDVLKAKASEVEDDIKSLERQFNSIQDIIARSGGYWIGTAGEKARKEFDAQKESSVMVIRRFKEHPGKLLTMAGIYDVGERSAVSESNKLATDIIA